MSTLVYTFENLAKVGLRSGGASDPMAQSLAAALEQYVKRFGGSSLVTISFDLKPAGHKLGMKAKVEADEPLLIQNGKGTPVGVKILICTLSPADLSDQDS